MKKTGCSLLLFVFAIPTVVWAGGSGMPWEGPLTTIMDSISGPVSQVLGFIAVVGAGLGIAFSEHGSGASKLFKVFFGVVVTFTAASFFLGFLGFGGGVAL